MAGSKRRPSRKSQDGKGKRAVNKTDYWKTKRDTLVREGVCIVEDILDSMMLSTVRSIAAKKISQLSDEHRHEQKSTGSMLPNRDMPELVDLITWPKTLEALHQIGFNDIKFSRAYLISKPAHGPPLFWHQDCTVWKGEPRAYTEITPLLFGMFYLTDTNRKNGCLRVIPGSHRRRHPLHKVIGSAHTARSRSMEDPDSSLYAEAEGEVDVPVRAGDLVLGDGRTLHAAHANQSHQERTVITVWYHPMFSDQQEATQAQTTSMAQTEIEHWPERARQAIAPIVANYSGSVGPLPRERVPGPQLH